MQSGQRGATYFSQGMPSRMDVGICQAQAHVDILANGISRETESVTVRKMKHD